MFECRVHLVDLVWWAASSLLVVALLACRVYKCSACVLHVIVCLLDIYICSLRNSCSRSLLTALYGMNHTNLCTCPTLWSVFWCFFCFVPFKTNCTFYPRDCCNDVFACIICHKITNDTSMPSYPKPPPLASGTPMDHHSYLLEMIKSRKFHQGILHWMMARIMVKNWNQHNGHLPPSSTASEVRVPFCCFSDTAEQQELIQSRTRHLPWLNIGPNSKCNHVWSSLTKKTFTPTHRGSCLSWNFAGAYRLCICLGN